MLWKLLGRSSSDDTAGAAPAAPPPAPVRNEIAAVEMMGASAVATLTVTALEHENGATLLSDLLHNLAESGARNFVLDMQNVQFMDTTCLGCLVEATRQLAGRGGRIALVNPDHGVSYLFRLTRLDRVFPICADVMSALAAVERAPGAPSSKDDVFWKNALSGG
jgi:anti-anti-sigma factor